MAFLSSNKSMRGRMDISMPQPIFVKSYCSDERALTGLNEKLKNAPSESKHIFRDAIHALGMKAKLHEEVYKIIANVRANYLVMHNLKTHCRNGNGSSDFALMIQSAIISVDCIIPEHKRTFDETYEDIIAIRRRLSDQAEHNAYVLSRSLMESKILPKKYLDRVYPICVIIEPEEKSADSFEVSAEKSLGYPEVYSSSYIPLTQLHSALEQLAEHDDKLKVSDKKLRAASDYLVEYAKNV